MIPPQVQVHVAVFRRAGTPPIVTHSAGGVQGAVTTGTHGAVGDPPALARATAGLEGVEHMPKVMMLVSGTKSITVAAGIIWQATFWFDVTVSGEGVIPKEH